MQLVIFEDAHIHRAELHRTHVKPVKDNSNKFHPTLLMSFEAHEKGVEKEKASYGSDPWEKKKVEEEKQ